MKIVDAIEDSFGSEVADQLMAAFDDNKVSTGDALGILLTLFVTGSVACNIPKEALLNAVDVMYDKATSTVSGTDLAH